MRLQARAPPYGDANSFSPPLYITRSDIDEIVQRYACAEPRIAGAGATRVVASVLIEKFAGSVMATTIMPAHGMGPGLRACQANDGGGAEEELQRGHACFETRPFGRSSLMALRKPLILRRPRSGMSRRTLSADPANCRFPDSLLRRSDKNSGGSAR
jgi:hypothetical protein